MKNILKDMYYDIDFWRIMAWFAGIIVTIVFLGGFVMLMMEENKHNEAARRECGDFRVIGSSIKTMWWYWRDGVYEVTCATNQKGVARVVEIRVP